MHKIQHLRESPIFIEMCSIKCSLRNDKILESVLRYIHVYLREYISINRLEYMILFKCI